MLQRFVVFLYRKMRVLVRRFANSFQTQDHVDHFDFALLAGPGGEVGEHEGFEMARFERVVDFFAFVLQPFGEGVG